MMAGKSDILEQLQRIELPDGGNLVSRGMVKALNVEDGVARFVIEAPDAAMAKQMGPLRAAAERAALSVNGVHDASVVLTAHGPAPAAPPKAPPPDLKIGRHPKQQDEPAKPEGVASILAIASGKGGVGKSTLTTNLAVALARAGRRVGVLDADIYGPSQPRMLGLEGHKVTSKDSTHLDPAEAHGVKMMSIGLLLEEGQAVVWRGPMLMGALQQLIGEVAWGELDVLLVDLPPGTGDVQLSLSQQTELTGAIVVSTPQDVALLDARKGIDMFKKLGTEVLGLVENMSTYTCPKCGHSEPIFGAGGVEKEAAQLGMPLLATLPIDLQTRLGGDAGAPVALGTGPVADAYASLAARLIADGVA